MSPAERAAAIAEVERLDAERRRAEHRARVASHLPERFRDRTTDELLASIRHPEFRRVATRWTWGHPGCVLSAPSRHGKTTALAVVYRRLMASEDPRWRSLRWVTLLRLVKARQDARSSRDDVDPAPLYERASLVVLDDLGQEPATDWSREVLHELLEVRYGAGLPTLSTSELTQAQLLDRYGAATLARLLEANGLDGKVVDAGR